MPAGDGGASEKSVPQDAEVAEVARAELDAARAPLGIAKLLKLLQESHSWSLSEKRLKRILQNAGLRGTPPSSGAPKSRVDTNLPLPHNVRAEYFDKTKGRGLVATTALREGSEIFVEDAFVAAPPPSQTKNLVTGQICDQCFLPTASSSLAVPCKSSQCGAKYCNRMWVMCEYD